MKIKGWLILSAVVQIALALYSICVPENIVATQMALFQNLMDNYISTVEEIVATSIINAILSIIIGLIALTNNVEKRKGTLIILYIVISAITPDIITLFVAVITIAVLASIKRVKKEKVKFKMGEAVNLLKVKDIKLTKKQIILISLLVVVYFIQLVPVPTWILTLPKIVRMVLIVEIYLVLFILALLAFYKEIKQGFSLIKKNFKLYMKYVLRVFAVVYVIYVFTNLATILVTNKNTSVNQESVEMLPMYIMAPLAIIWAPIVEETVFRGALRKIIKNDAVYIFMSASIFALMHVINEGTIGLALATAMPYMVLGVAFAYVYAKTNNLAGNIIFHSMYNALATVFVLFL